MNKSKKNNRIRLTIQLSPYISQEVRRLSAQNKVSVSTTVRALLLRSIEEVILHEESDSRPAK